MVPHPTQCAKSSLWLITINGNNNNNNNNNSNTTTTTTNNNNDSNKNCGPEADMCAAFISTESPGFSFAPKFSSSWYLGSAGRGTDTSGQWPISLRPISLLSSSLLRLLDSSFSRQFPMGLGIPPLKIKILLESNPLKSIILARRWAVLASEQKAPASPCGESVLTRRGRRNTAGPQGRLWSCVDT